MVDLNASGCVRLVCAVTLAGIKDARKGDESARAWLLKDAPIWLESIGFASIDEANLIRILSADEVIKT